jgi:hypothetical protein
MAGGLHLVAADRLTPPDLSMRTALKSLGGLVSGSAVVFDGVAGELKMDHE